MHCPLRAQSHFQVADQLGSFDWIILVALQMLADFIGSDQDHQEPRRQ